MKLYKKSNVSCVHASYLQLQVHIGDIPFQNCIYGPYYCSDLTVKKKESVLTYE